VSDGITVQMDLSELDAVQRALDAGLTDFTIPAGQGFQVWKVVVYAAWSKMRRDGGSFRGQTWEALEDDTRPEKPNAIINQDSGQLMRAILKCDMSGKTTGKPKMDGGKVLLIGDDLPPYGKFALAMKGRNVLFFVSGDVELFAKALDLYLQKLIRDADRRA
jgi:hypothetical protein